MKKFLVAILAIVLALSLGLVACDPEGPAGTDKVTITVLDTLELKVGETPDFNGHVKVLVNDVEVPNPTVTSKLLTGDPTVAGRCTYSITYVHNGAEYKKNGFVNFHTDNVVLTASNFNAVVGDAIDWKAHVTVTVNGATVSNPELSVAIKNGDADAAGDVVYTITYNYEGTNYTKDVIVTYTDVDPDDTDLIETMFTTEYDSYTVDYCYYEVEAPTESMTSKEKVVLGAPSLVQINYADNSATSPQTMDYYLSINGATDTLLHYFSSTTEETTQWQYQTYSLENDGAEYGELLPYGYAPYDVTVDGALPAGLSKTMFTRESETLFSVKDAFLGDVAELLFPYDYSAQYTTYTKIELETDGSKLTKVTGYFTNNMYEELFGITFDCVVSYTWSDIDATTVTLPQDATEYFPYVAPSQGQDLTADQTTAITEALDKTYNNVTYEYIDLKDDYWYSFMCSGNYSTDATYDEIVQFYREYGEPVVEASQNRLFANGKIYSFYNDQGDYYSTDSTSTVAEQTYYIAFADFHFTADMFGVTEDGTYVIKADKLETIQPLVAKNAWILGSVYSLTLKTFTFKIDADNNVTEWYFIGTCVAANKDGTAGDSFNVEMSGKYSAFETTTIAIPGLPDATDITDQTVQDALDDALSADYSNVTIQEYGNNSTMRITENKVRVDGISYNEQGKPSAFNNTYVIKNGQYYEIIGGSEKTEPTPAIDANNPQNGVFFNILKFDFSVLQGKTWQYNAETGTYIYHVTDGDGFNNDNFAYYWTDFFGENQQVTDIELTIQGGHVVGVRMYVTITETYVDEDTQQEVTEIQYNTMSAALSAFGETNADTDPAAGSDTEVAA